MPRASGVPSAESDKDTVVRLLEVSRADPGYRDLYLRRARARFAPLLSEPEYRGAKERQAEIEDLLRRTRTALERHDWLQVQELTGRARALRRGLDDTQGLLDLAATLYDDAEVPLDRFSPGVPGVSASGSVLAGLRDRGVAALRDLEREDPAWQMFYRDRRARFEALDLAAAPSVRAAVGIDVSRVVKDALEALERGNLDHLEHLIGEVVTGPRPDPEPEGRRNPAPVGGDVVPLAESTLERARQLGLAPARLQAAGELGEYLQCCCAWQATLPARPLTEGPRRMAGCTCGHACPPAVSGVLKENLDLLMVHPFVTSAGVRYLPRFVAEEVLVEDFPEADVPVSGSELHLALGLARRRAVSRLELEGALLRRGPDVVEQALGLPPDQFRLVCVPFDVYCRLAPSRGWGQQPLWTHFDGYQVLKEGRLRALVGGDVRFGGAHDVCSISRADEREKVVTRLAIVRRERLSSGERG